MWVFLNLSEISQLDSNRMLKQIFEREREDSDPKNKGFLKIKLCEGANKGQ